MLGVMPLWPGMLSQVAAQANAGLQSACNTVVQACTGGAEELDLMEQGPSLTCT